VDDVNSESLADIIRAHQSATGDSSRDMQANARKAGARLSFTTVNSILNGDHTGAYKPYTLDAIAVVCGRSRSEVWRAAGRQLPSKPFADELPPGSDDLSPRSRRAVVGVIRALLAAEGADAAAEDEPSNVRRLDDARPTRSDRPKAARRGTPGEGGNGDDG
jgi:hypothetical protein